MNIKLFDIVIQLVYVCKIYVWEIEVEESLKVYYFRNGGGNIGGGGGGGKQKKCVRE